MARPTKAQSDLLAPSKNRILEAASLLFSQGGVEGTGIRDIARKAGLNEGTLYHYFPSKTALLEALLDKLTLELLEPGYPLPPPKDQDIKTWLTVGLKTFFSRTEENHRQLWRILMMEQYRVPRVGKFLAEKILEGPRGYFTAVMEEARERNCLNPSLSPRAAGALTAALLFEFSFRAQLPNLTSPGEAQTLWDRLLADWEGLMSLLFP